MLWPHCAKLSPHTHARARAPPDLSAFRFQILKLVLSPEQLQIYRQYMEGFLHAEKTISK